MIVKPTVSELLKRADNRYELVIASARRARQIANGDRPLTKVKEESPVTLAVNEIAEGEVIIEREDKENNKEQEKQEEIKEEVEETEEQEAQEENDEK